MKGEAVEGTLDSCINCKQEIVFRETTIDDFWTHTPSGPGFCDPDSNWIEAKEWATPEHFIVKFDKQGMRYTYAPYTWWERVKLRWWMLWNQEGN